MTLESELETIRTNIVTNLTSKGVTASNNESLNDLVGKVNTVKTPITSTLVLKETYQNDISGVVDCLRDKFRINLSKQGVETLSTDGLTTLSNSISLIKFDTVLTLTSDKSSASTGETVTLTATLVDVTGNPVNGATIIFMEGNTTLYSSITNNLGVINYTYSSTVEGSKSLKCVFEGNTEYNLCNSNAINISYYLYYDDCTTDKSSNYTNRYTFGDSTGTCTINYVDYNTGYKVITTKGSQNNTVIAVPISNLNYKNNFTLELDYKQQSSWNQSQIGFSVANSSNYGLAFRFWGDRNIYIVGYNGSGTDLYHSTISYDSSNWVHLKLIVTNNTFRWIIQQNNTTLLDTTLSNSNYGEYTTHKYGLLFNSYASPYYFKNVKAYSN